LEPTFNGLLEEERRLDLLRALRDDLQAAALGMRRWLELETYTSFAGFEAAPETAPRTVLSLWTGLSNALQDDALARSYIWREVLGAEAAAARSAEEKQLVSEAQKFLEEYRAATRSLREKLDSEWQELLQQEADAQELSEFLKRQREQQPTAQRRAAEVKRLAAGE
jgi:hypothetical protein